MDSNIDYEDIVWKMIDTLIGMDDGSSVTTVMLLKELGYDEAAIDPEEMVKLRDLLFETAKKTDLELDESPQEDKPEGVPPMRDFVVHNSEYKNRCPYCFGNNTARILYGKPLMTEALEQELREGKIRLGGCMINTIEVDGERIVTSPDRWCNDCELEYSSKPIDMDILISNIDTLRSDLFDKQ